MSKIELDLPPSIHKALRALAKKDGVSAKQMIVSAVSEKVAALHTLDYLEQRAARGSREKFLQILDCVPARPPLKGDALPPDMAEKVARMRAARRPPRLN